MISFLLAFARPLLWMHFTSYIRDVQRAPFPVDAPGLQVPGPSPSRLLFIGDVAMSGYGVLHHGMTTPARIARLVSRLLGRGCSWRTTAAPDLTAARVARMTKLCAVDIDAALIMLGIPDVLLATRASKWAADLRAIATRIRAEAGDSCRIVFAAIPPMTDFRAIPDPGRRLLTLQIARLNRAMTVVASEIPNAVFVPFPKWETNEKYVEETFSWKAMHKKLAWHLTPAILDPAAHDSTPPSRRSEVSA